MQTMTANYSTAARAPESWPTTTLSEQATILRAPLIKSENQRDGRRFRLASITDMDDHGYLPTPQRVLHLVHAEPLARKYELQDHDVLLSIVGTVGRITIVPPNRSESWISASNMLIIRFREEQRANAIAFTMFMKGPKGRAILDELTHGTSIPMISKKAFSKTRIPQLSERVRMLSTELFEKERSLYRQQTELLQRVYQLQATYPPEYAHPPG